MSDQECSSVTDTVIGNAPVGSYLSYQLFDKKNHTLLTVDRPADNLAINNQVSAIKAFPQLPLENECNQPYTLPSNLEQSQSNFLKEVGLNLQECRELEKLTVCQLMEPEWMTQRNKRLTTSNFGKIMKRKKPPSESF